MAPRKTTWHHFDYHTTENVSSQLTSDGSKPLRQSSTPISPSPQSLAQDRRHLSSIQAGGDNSEQQSNTATLQALHESQNLINREHLNKRQAPRSLFSDTLDPRSWPGSVQVSNSTANVRGSTRHLEYGGVLPKQRALVPAQSRQSCSPGRPIKFVAPFGPSRLQDGNVAQSHLPADGTVSPSDPSSSLNPGKSLGDSHTSAGDTNIRPNPATLLPAAPLVPPGFRSSSIPSHQNIDRPVASLIPSGCTSSSIPSNSQASWHGSAHKLARKDIASGYVMASQPYRVSSGDARRPSRMENRPPMSTVLCRNGPQCRKYVEGTHFHTTDMNCVR